MKIKKGKSMCFFSAKGGVGKTTNILNLAGILEQMNKKVLVIDFDLYSGGIAIYLNCKYEKSIYNLSEDLMNNTFTKLSDYTIMYDNYIDIIPSPIDPRYANKIYGQYIKRIIEEATTSYDVVLIDMSHSLDEINLNILECVDEILFVTTNDPLDLKNLRSLISIFNTLEIKNYKILLNQSRDPFKEYFSKYDIKKILKHNIDYTLSEEMYLKDIDRYIVGGYIISLDRKFKNIMSNDYQTFIVMATDLLGGENE